MKVKVISRSTDEFIRERMQDLQRVYHNFDPDFRSQEKAVEYVRALNAAKLDKGVTFELDEDMIREDEEMEAMQELINNSKLSEGYLTLARDIEVMELKSPEVIYKAHLLDGRGSGGGTVDSSRQNLAATFVNAFLNAGFDQDKLMTVQSEASSGGGSSTN